jgi:hypothetical protein
MFLTQKNIQIINIHNIFFKKLKYLIKALN